MGIATGQGQLYVLFKGSFIFSGRDPVPKCMNEYKKTSECDISDVIALKRPKRYSLEISNPDSRYPKLEE